MRQSTTQGCITYEGNETRDQSENYAGAAVQVLDGHEGRRGSRGAATITFKNNTSYDQSLAVTGPMHGEEIRALGEAQQKIKLEALRPKFQAKEPARGASSSTVIDFIGTS